VNNIHNIHNIHNKKENKAKLQVYIYKVSRIQIHRTRIKVQGTDLLHFGENVVLSKIIKIYSQKVYIFLFLSFRKKQPALQRDRSSKTHKIYVFNLLTIYFLSWSWIRFPNPDQIQLKPSPKTIGTYLLCHV